MDLNTSQGQRQSDRYRLEVLANVAFEISQDYYKNLSLEESIIGIYASYYPDKKVLETMKGFIESIVRNSFGGIHCEIFNLQDIETSEERLAAKYDITYYLDDFLSRQNKKG